MTCSTACRLLFKIDWYYGETGGGAGTGAAAVPGGAPEGKMPGPPAGFTSGFFGISAVLLALLEQPTATASKQQEITPQISRLIVNPL